MKRFLGAVHQASHEYRQADICDGVLASQQSR